MPMKVGHGLKYWRPGRKPSKGCAEGTKRIVRDGRLMRLLASAHPMRRVALYDLEIDRRQEGHNG